MKHKKLTASSMSRLIRNSGLNTVTVTAWGRKMLHEISNLMEVFKPLDKTGKRGIWIELPNTSYSSESSWFFISITSLNEHHYLEITQKEGSLCSISDCKDRYCLAEKMTWILRPLIDFLKEKIPIIALDPDAYNKYVDDNLPHHQRTGRITRKDLGRIVPWKRLSLKEPHKCIQVLKACINKVRGPFNGRITNDLYTKYYNIAKHTYDEYYGHLFNDDYTMFGPSIDKNQQDDESPDEYLQDFQYGEIGWSGMTLYLTDGEIPAERYFELNIGLDSNIAVGLEVAVSLYDSGCPLIIRDAQRLLDIVEEKGEVILTSNKDFDCLVGQDKRSVFELPNKYEIGKPYELTRAQYDEIVSLAQWEPVEQVALNNETNSGYS